MADPAVIHDDLVLFLTSWYRTWLAGRPEANAASVKVMNQEPQTTETFPSWLLVIEDDGGPATSIVTAERSVRLSLLGSTKDNPKPLMDLARLVAAGLSLTPAPDSGQNPLNPVAVVDTVNGPFLVPEAQPRARALITATLVVVGRQLI